jgi:hypothetical protein
MPKQKESSTAAKLKRKDRATFILGVKSWGQQNVYNNFVTRSAKDTPPHATHTTHQTTPYPSGQLCPPVSFKREEPRPEVIQ